MIVRELIAIVNVFSLYKVKVENNGNVIPIEGAMDMEVNYITPQKDVLLVNVK